MTSVKEKIQSSNNEYDNFNSFDLFDAVDMKHEYYNSTKNYDHIEKVVNEKVKCKPINTWYCTDTWVGMYAYYLDGELVLITTQSGRKCDKIYHHVSGATYRKLKEFLKTLFVEHDESLEIKDLDLEQDINSFYTDNNLYYLRE